MKLLSIIIVSLPAVSANYPWWTNSGWAKPADYNSRECAGNPNTHYFCVCSIIELFSTWLIVRKGIMADTTGGNAEPKAFPWRRDTCALADTLGRGCHWQGAVGSVSLLAGLK